MSDFYHWILNGFMGLMAYTAILQVKHFQKADEAIAEMMKEMSTKLQSHDVSLAVHGEKLRSHARALQMLGSTEDSYPGVNGNGRSE